MEIRIRKTTLSDYKEIYDLLKSEDMVFDKFTKERFARMLKKNGNYFFVAVIDDLIVGSVFANDDGGYYGYVYKIAVKKDVRRKGVAQLLTQRALEEFDKRDILWIYAHVRKENLPSINLLKKLGFKIRESHFLLDNWN